MYGDDASVMYVSSSSQATHYEVAGGQCAHSAGMSKEVRSDRLNVALRSW